MNYVLYNLSDLDIDMEDKFDPEVKKETPSKQGKNPIDSSQGKTLQKSTPKVVKNPLFSSSAKPTSKKETEETPKIQQPAQTNTKESTSSDKPETKGTQPKVEQKLAGETTEQKSEKQEKEGQIRPKKKTFQELFSQPQPQPRTIPSTKIEKSEQKLQQLPKEIAKKEQNEASQIKQTVTVSQDVSNLISEKIVVEPQQQEITIKVTVLAHIGTTLNKNIALRIEGKDKHGSFSIKRKYTEFKALRKLLKERWPGCFIPGLTSKSEVKNQEEKEKDLTLTLQNFILGLTYSPLMYYKEEIQLFLRSPHIEVQEMSAKMPTLKMKDVISRFNSYFEEGFFQGKFNESLIKDFTVVLRKVLSVVPALQSKALHLCQIYDSYGSGMSKFSQFSKMYQKSFLLFYSNNKLENTLVCKDTSKLIDKLHDYSSENPFYQLYNFLSCEERDSQAFLDVIIASELFSLKKDELDIEIKQCQKEVEQIAMGHKTLKTVTSRKTKEQVKSDLQKKLVRIQEDKQSAGTLYSMTSVLLDKLSIQTYKKFKRDQFRKVLKGWSRHTKKLIPEIEALWSVFEDELKTLLK